MSLSEKNNYAILKSYLFYLLITIQLHQTSQKRKETSPEKNTIGRRHLPKKHYGQETSPKKNYRQERHLEKNTTVPYGQETSPKWAGEASKKYSTGRRGL